MTPVDFQLRRVNTVDRFSPALYKNAFSHHLINDNHLLRLIHIHTFSVCNRNVSYSHKLCQLRGIHCKNSLNISIERNVFSEHFGTPLRVFD